LAKESARLAFRATLRDAAEQVFVRSGFHATKMADIAKAAGVAVGTLYNYFDSKEVIFEEILAARGAEFRATLEPSLQIRSPIERLTAVVHGALEYIDKHSALFAIIHERGGLAEYDLHRIGGDLTEREYVGFLGQLGDCLRAAVQAGELRRDVAVPIMVAALSGAMNGATYAWLKRKRRGRLSAAADDLLTLFLAGARAR
jgi:AcrR family transcriptional regulator